MSRSQMLLEKDLLLLKNNFIRRVSYLFSKAFIKILLKENRNNDMEIVNPFAISSNSEEEEESENKAAETIPDDHNVQDSVLFENHNFCFRKGRKKFS
jgi:hypothetical protein